MSECERERERERLKQSKKERVREVKSLNVFGRDGFIVKVSLGELKTGKEYVRSITIPSVYFDETVHVSIK